MVNQLTFEHLKTRALELVGSLAKADYKDAYSRFDDGLKNALAEGMLQVSWEQLLVQAGSITQVSGIETAEMAGYRIVFVTCQLEKAAVNVQVVFNDQGTVSGLNFIPLDAAAITPYHPPAYVEEASFREADVTVGSGEWALPGTLSMPEGAGPFPGVVLVHGSGPNDRDETLGPNKVFRDLAWGLASRGIAVIRYDKRTLAHKNKYNEELVSTVTVKEEVIDDALLAVRLLRITPKVDPERVFVLGHSLGATLAPRIGMQDQKLAGLIIMAGSTRPIEDTILDQITYIYSLAGPLTEAQKASIEALKVQIARVKSPDLSDKTPLQDMPLGMPARYYLSFRGYRPAEVAKDLPMPMLILQGERDYQVTAAQDFEGWRIALHDKKNVTLKICPGLNHLFIAGEGRSTPHEYNIEGHVDQDVVKTIGGWIENL